MCFTSILVCWRELPRWTTILVEDQWLPYPLSRLKQVMSQHIFQLTLFQLQMDKFSSKHNSSTRVLDQPSTWDYLSAGWVRLLRLRLWSRLLVNLNLSWLNIVRWLPLLSSVLIWMLLPSSFWTEVLSWQSYWSKSNLYIWYDIGANGGWRASVCDICWS